jgi:hypothetical protein
VCILQESADLPSVVNSLAASRARRIQERGDKGGIASALENPYLLRRRFLIKRSSLHQHYDEISILAGRKLTWFFGKAIYMLIFS